MKTKKLLKQTLTIIAATSILLILNIGESKAALQANPNTQYTKADTPVNWMANFRQMETAGGAMGLNETLNSDLTASSKSNGIDVHMMKATEYGAIAILSASGYGNFQTLQNSTIKTTTGNNTGIYFSGSNWESVAGGLEGYIFSGVNSIYYDGYNASQSSAKAGDAFGNSSTTNPGCTGWHSANGSRWVSNDNSRFYFVRGGGGLFSFVRNYYLDGHYLETPCVSRGVAVVGSGF